MQELTTSQGAQGPPEAGAAGQRPLLRAPGGAEPLWPFGLWASNHKVISPC